MSVAVHHSDMLEWLAAYEGPLFDSCVTDPPYHLSSIVKRFGAGNAAPAKVGATGAYARASRGFMGKEWDGGDIAFRPETWRAVYDKLKPGAHLVAFSGTRTYHRMACAIEDAGFEIRDQLQWLYGSGFPKSHDVSKGIDRANGDARPIVGPSRFLSRRPNGTGGVSSVGIAGDGGIETSAASAASAAWQGWGTALKPAVEPICLARKPLSEKSVAANVLKHGTGVINVNGCRVDSERPTGWAGAGAGAGVWNAETCGLRKPGDARPVEGRWPANVLHDGSAEVLAGFPETLGAVSNSSPNGSQSVASGDFGPMLLREERADSGSAARFFYSAKAGPLDRIGTKHATVKPVDVMRWLCRLVTPLSVPQGDGSFRRGHILEPFAGSGTTGIAAMAEGFDCTMIELEADHFADIERKLAYLRGEGRSRFVEHDRKAAHGEMVADHGPLFS